MTGRGDYRKLFRRLTARGYQVFHAPSGHWKIYRNEQLVYTTSFSPSDWRTMRNLKKDLKRKGIL